MAAADLADLDWSGQRRTGSYSDSKLFVTTLAVAVAGLWPDVCSNAVDPGWVPTRMGGRHAPDDLRLGHLTQVWLATSDDAEARTSGGYWFHQQRGPTHPAAATSVPGQTAHRPRDGDRYLATLIHASSRTAPDAGRGGPPPAISAVARGGGRCPPWPRGTWKTDAVAGVSRESAQRVDRSLSTRSLSALEVS